MYSNLENWNNPEAIVTFNMFQPKTPPWYKELHQKPALEQDDSFNSLPGCDIVQIYFN